MTAAGQLPDALLRGLCDDAAIFPPGNLALELAVPAHLEHLRAPHAALVGPFIVAAGRLPELGGLLEGQPAGSFGVALTVPMLEALAPALAAADAIPAVRVEGVEVALDADTSAEAVVPLLDEALAAHPDVAVFVEVPRDARRPDLVAALAGTPYLAKFRTGGVRADLYPDETELAEAVVAAARAGVPFKATAGLHHAVRNTDPATGFEQHGFVNLIAAVDAALDGADVAEVERLLAERDGTVLAAFLRDALDESTATRLRAQFRSFGTCSIAEPVAELADLGLLDPALATDTTTPEGSTR
ncbi:hypothetical protein GHK92_04515 [Nocardioides sp. dk4132]|uniref:hypothetical protein n=1 Tax=unclassified Nocardioides TaxID=2615069 RepID=UPI00129624F7|nr:MULTISPECIES: hypothetical protein [unclassified Nocardioides]MQW75128.1 hypothetical protein [Nocardioides sp. dk4132]QGA07705.1 hypothetical protein GFH29_10090 [Nocardioides sp. dk884]